MKHIKTFIIPDCVDCGAEMQQTYMNVGKFDADHPFGTGVEGWWECPQCGHQSEHYDYRPYSKIYRDEVTEKGVFVL